MEKKCILNHSLTHSPSLFDAAGNEVYALEKNLITKCSDMIPDIYGIMPFFLPSTQKPQLPSQYQRPITDTHCAYLARDGQAEMTWVAGYMLR